MRYLSAALYAEGSTDVHFLRPLLQRACAACASEAAEPVETSDLIDLHDRREHRHLTRDRRILEAARSADGAWTVLFIHADADGNARRALQERIAPAQALLAETFGRRGQTVAVVPVRMTEAWTLADTEALRRAFGTTLSDQELGLIEAAAHSADRLPNPKATLARAFERSRRGRRAGSVSPYLGLIGETASLDRLRRLEAYRLMESDLRCALRNLGIVP